MARTTLERFGYRALTADNGATALGIFASQRRDHHRDHGDDALDGRPDHSRCEN